MTKNVDFEKVYLRLMKAAQAGDPRAKLELMKLQQAARQVQQLTQLLDDNDDEMTEEMLGAQETVPGTGPPGDVFAPDKLDVVENIQNAFHNADSLEQKVRLRNALWSGLNDVAKFMRIQPASALQGTLGGQQLIDVIANPAGIQVVNWNGDDAETLPLTLTFCPTQQINDDPFWLRPYAIIQFGTRGFMVKAEVDIGRGTQLTVSGSAITGQVALDPYINADGSITPTTATLTGMLSFYPCVRAQPNTRTRYIDNWDDPLGASSIINVPPFAKAVAWFGHSEQTANVTLDFLTTQGNPVYTLVIPSSATMTLQQITYIPLTGDITRIGVTGQVKPPGDDSVGRLIFQLTI